MRLCARGFLLANSAFLASLAAPARAADCKPLQILNTIKLERIDDGNRFLVPVAIDGRPEKFILDTGGYVTQIEGDAAKDLGLRRVQGEGSLYDVHGHGSNLEASMASFGIGQMVAKNITIQVSPLSRLHESGGAVGLLSTDLFAEYDIDLDFGASRLNYFSQDHCSGKVAYWQERPIAIVPFRLESNHLNIPITLDGQDVRAIIDTGAELTVMTTTAASEIFAIVPGSSDTPQEGVSSSDPELKYYSHPFSRLTFDGLEVSNPRISIMTDRVAAAANVEKSSFRGTTNDPYARTRLEPLIIGMNILKHLHVYIAYKEKKLYITPAGSGESVLFQAPAAPAK